ncbi:MAG TPA: VWA domain-containing protein [Gemmatimonadaceae bacterium]|nr:VWA domain-containing protein [Gemmatimonadaceae bacterium]
MPFTLRTDRRLIRAGSRSTRYLLASIVAPSAPPRVGRLPVNVALVLDRSGSMDGERKFDLAREAVERALALLRPEDRFTLVVYDDVADVLAESTEATPEARRLALARLGEVQPRGSTDLHAGWSAGAAQLARRLDERSVARALLLTDGLANQGITARPALAAVAADLRNRGITTSTFGVGADFDERLLRDVAHEGGGNFYFVESAAQIPDLLTSELGEALEIVARGVALVVDLPAGGDGEALNRNRSSRDANGALRIELGDLVSGQELEIVVKVRFDVGAAGTEASVSARLVDRAGALGTGEERRAWRYASHDENDAQPRDVVVDRAVATLHAARARAEATEANRDGDFRRARRVLERTAERIRGYAHGDPELEALWRSLRDDVGRYAEEVMTAMQLKASFYVAESVAKGRAPDGKARRAPRPHRGA